MNPNIQLVLQLLITNTNLLAQYSAVLQKALAEGRDVTEAELLAARTAAVGATGALLQGALPPAV